MSFTAGTVEVSRPDSFAIKGVLLPLTLIDVRSDCVESVTKELSAKVESAPGFFTGSAVVLSFESLESPCPNHINEVIATSRGLGFRIAGLKGDAVALIDVALDLELAHFPAGRVRSTPVDPVPELSSAVGAVQHDMPKPVAQTKTVTLPVRSGQQVFSDGDLVVVAPVSAGAELLAVGSIHVYAPMRGRALAGVQGDETARIFCMSQEAELVSIAGHFMIDENLQQACWKKAAQVSFDGDELRVEPIAASLT